jgi:hypothetical protein
VDSSHIEKLLNYMRGIQLTIFYSNDLRCLKLRGKLGSLLVLVYTSHCMSMNYEFDILDANHFLLKKLLATYLMLINSDFFDN